MLIVIKHMELLLCEQRMIVQLRQDEVYDLGLCSHQQSMKKRTEWQEIIYSKIW